MKKHLLAILLTTAATGAFAQTPAPAQESAASRLAAQKLDKDQLRMNLESVGKLLTVSSAAKQIDSTKAPEAVTRRDKALDLHRKATAAFESGDLQATNALLMEARSIFFEAVRFAAPEEVRAKQIETDYKSRLESVQALLGAYKRVANEKGSAAKGVADTVGQIEKSVAQAEKLAQARRHQEGLAELDRAYLVAKAGVSGLRSGDTLVRSLNFASKEEEYHYEIDRNNTHQMLLKVLVEEKKSLDGMIQSYVAKASQLRTQAEAAAAAKDFAAAVRLLEEATTELVKAIRNAGVFIPS
jgi:hypothetical protein